MTADFHCTSAPDLQFCLGRGARDRNESVKETATGARDIAAGTIQGKPLDRDRNGRIVFTAWKAKKGIILALPLFLRTIEGTSFSTWMRESESPFVFYFILFVHTVGLALLVGANAVIDLRLLGVAREIPLSPLKRLFGLMWLGFWINVTSGILLLFAY